MRFVTHALALCRAVRLPRVGAGMLDGCSSVQPNQRSGRMGGDRVSMTDWLNGTLVRP